ncbi:hypothetical protein L7F22_058243 [Adiantum nelumboides]|nr:hypothetical protein [Adiantum nelumboides]
MGAKPNGCDSAYRRQGDRLKHVSVSTVSSFSKEHDFVVGGNMGGVMYERDPPDFSQAMVRQASPAGETGMLVVESLVPGGPAHKHLEPGDVLVRVNGEIVTQFLRLETLLDDNIGSTVIFEVERGGQTRESKLMVQDFHLITPDFFLEVSGGVIHPLSYQQARNFCFKCGLVYVAVPGYMLSRAGVPKHAIIKKLAGEDIYDVEGFLSIVLTLAKGVRVPLEFYTYTDRHRSKLSHCFRGRKLKDEVYRCTRAYSSIQLQGLLSRRCSSQTNDELHRTEYNFFWWGLALDAMSP